MHQHRPLVRTQTLRSFRLLPHLALCALAAFTSLSAKNIYLNPHAPLSGEGSSWATALRTLPTQTSFWDSIEAGDTVWVSSGECADPWTIKAGGSESAPLVIRRATQSHHGDHNGWTSSMDDGPTTLRSVALSADNVVIDGMQEGGFHIRVPGVDRGSGVQMQKPHNNITLRFIQIEGPGFNNSANTRAIDITPDAAGSRGLTIDHCEMFNISNGIYAVNVDEVLIESCSIHDINNSGTIHENALFAQGVTGMTFRGNRLKNTSAEGVFLRAKCYQWDVYANVFDEMDMGVATKSGYSHSRVRVHNNTFHNVKHPVAFKDPGDSGELYNNIFYPSAFGVMLTRAIHHDYNWYGGCDKKGEQYGTAGGSENPFINAGQGNFGLIATSSALDGGRNLGWAYARDASGNERPVAGNWDRGAFEQSASGGEQSGSITDALDEGGLGTEHNTLDAPDALSQVQEPQLLTPYDAQPKVNLPVNLTWEAWTDESRSLEQMVLIGTRPDLADADTLQATPTDEMPKDSAQAAAGALGGVVTMASLLCLPRGLRRRTTVLGVILLGGVIALAGCGINDINDRHENITAVALQKNVSDLQPGTTYYWQAVTRGADEEVSSVVQSFTVAK